MSLRNSPDKPQRAMTTVRVPDSMRDLFDKAEEVVARFFNDRIDDPACGTIEIRDERYVLLRGASLSVEFFDLVRGLYGEERQAQADEFSRAILFDLAHSLGTSDERRIEQKMQLTDPMARLSAGPVHFAHTGWASVAILPESHASADEEFFLVYDNLYSFESDAWVRAGLKSDQPVCIMSAGYSSGWCEESYGMKLVAAELLCRGKGDETCRLAIAPPHRITGRIEEYLARHPEIAARAAGFRVPGYFARKREEETLERRRDQLERELRHAQKMEALGRMAGGIAHDFNNIIGVVLGQAMLAQRRLPENDPVAKDLAKIIRAGRRGASLTQQLLACGRSQVARNELLAVNRVVEDMARMIGRVIGEDIELCLELAPDAGCVRADRAQLEQILMNLATNARDAMPGGGRLTILTAQDAELRVVLSVTDTGHGMDEETCARAFEPFFTTKGPKGTGLGLSTVYGIVAGAGGSVAIESRQGAGCTVRILLPRESESEGEAAQSAPAKTPSASGRTILVVEDGSDLREMLGDILRACGYEPILAETADDALTRLADTSQQVDVLLTDVVMPGMSGVELATRAIELRPTLNVLFMSGYAPDPRHRALFSGKGASFLQKPFTPDELTAKLAAFE